ncbi:MAG: hypothetical protein IPN33_14545 [Saprospiraceae bacterium]|nr:hypothetical protein [Saprospiraceae bacterium]
MLSPNFYTKYFFGQIIFDIALLSIFAFTVASILKEGLLKLDLIPIVSLLISIFLAIRIIYLLIISIRSIILKKWGLFAGCLVHTLIIGAIFYASLFAVFLSIGALGGGPAGY